jgi:hypothetical protein
LTTAVDLAIHHFDNPEPLMRKKANTLKRIQQAVTKLFGDKTAGDDSAILVSFPKSGRTWLRVMLDAAGLSIDYTHDFSGHRGQRHFSELGGDKSGYQDRRVIFLVRDPRDVVVSGYFQATKRLGVYEGPISEFIRDPKHGIEKIVIFNSEWLAAAKVPQDFCLIQYEEMHARLSEVLERVIRFANPSHAMPDLAKIIEIGRFENMREKETSGEFAKAYGGILEPGDITDPESFKCRKGKVGGYDEYLSADDIAYCDQVMRDHRYMEFLDEAARSAGISAN